MTYVLYDLVNHQSELFFNTDVAAVMVLITQEDADAAEIDDKFLREPMSQNFTGALAPWHYMISVSEFFGVDGSQKLACVSKNIFEVLWDKCPDKRHALYGGEGKKTKKEPKDLRPRAIKVKAESSAANEQDAAAFLKIFNEVANAEGYAEREDIKKAWDASEKNTDFLTVWGYLRKNNPSIFEMIL